MSSDSTKLADSWQAILERLGVLHNKHYALLREENEVCRKVFERMTALVERSVPQREKAPAWVGKLVISMQRGMEPKVVAPEKFLEPLSQDPFDEIKEWRENGKHFGYWYVHAKCGLQQDWPLEMASRTEMKAVFAFQLALARSQLELAMAAGNCHQASEFVTGYAEAMLAASDEQGKPILGRDFLSYPVRYLMIANWPDVERCQHLDQLCDLLLGKLPSLWANPIRKNIRDDYFRFKERIKKICQECDLSFAGKTP